MIYPEFTDKDKLMFFKMGNIEIDYYQRDFYKHILSDITFETSFPVAKDTYTGEYLFIIGYDDDYDSFITVRYVNNKFYMVTRVDHESEDYYITGDLSNDLKNYSFEV